MDIDEIFKDLEKLSSKLDKVAAPIPPKPEKVTIQEFFILPEPGVFYDEEKVTKTERRNFEVSTAVENFGASSIRWQSYDDPEDGPKRVVVFRGTEDLIENLTAILPEGLQVFPAVGVRLASSETGEVYHKVVCAACEHPEMLVDEEGFGECHACGYEDIIEAEPVSQVKTSGYYEQEEIRHDNALKDKWLDSYVLLVTGQVGLIQTARDGKLMVDIPPGPLDDADPDDWETIWVTPDMIKRELDWDEIQKLRTPAGWSTEHKPVLASEINIDPRVPTGTIKWLVDKYHVGTPDDEVRQDIEGRAATQTADPDLIRACGDYAVQVHHKNQGLYVDVMRGKKTSSDNDTDDLLKREWLDKWVKVKGTSLGGWVTHVTNGKLYVDLAPAELPEDLHIYSPEEVERYGG